MPFRIQFSLKTLFVISTVLAICCGVAIRLMLLRQRNAETADMVLSAGGTLKEESYFGISTIVGATLEHRADAVGIPVLDRLANVESLRMLCLDDCNLNARCFELVCGLRQLTELSLRENPIDSEQLSHLVRLKHLTKLDISDCGLTDDAIPTLNRLVSLERLNIAGNHLTLEAVSRLRLPSLKHLEAAYCEGECLDLGADGFGAMTGLSTLSLREAGFRRIITNEQICFRHLTSLDIAGMHCSLKGLARVFPNVTEIGIDETMISAEAMEEFCAFSQLTKIVIGTEVTHLKIFGGGSAEIVEDGLTLNVPAREEARIRALFVRLRATRKGFEITSGDQELHSRQFESEHHNSTTGWTGSGGPPF